MRKGEKKRRKERVKRGYRKEKQGVSKSRSEKKGKRSGE